MEQTGGKVCGNTCHHFSTAVKSHLLRVEIDSPQNDSASAAGGQGPPCSSHRVPAPRGSADHGAGRIPSVMRATSEKHA